MIERWCDFLLRRAASRWAAGDEMLAEWRAEVHGISSKKDKMWYALSLAASRPHRARVVALQRPLPGFLASFLVLLMLPYAYSVAAKGWWTLFRSDTVVGQSWLAAGLIAGAMVAGAGCARVSAGVTRVIKPVLLSAWVFGVSFLPELTETFLEPGELPWAHLIDHTVWMLGAIVSGIVLVRLTLRGRSGLSWLFLAVAAPAVFLLSKLHGLEHYFQTSLHIGIALSLAAQYFLHITLFGLVYIRGLAARTVAACPQ